MYEIFKCGQRILTVFLDADTSGAVHFFHFRFGAFFWKIVLSVGQVTAYVLLYLQRINPRCRPITRKKNKTIRRKTRKSLQHHSSLDPPTSRCTLPLSLLFFQSLGPAFHGGQLCVVNMEGDVAPYMRGLFVAL